MQPLIVRLERKGTNMKGQNWEGVREWGGGVVVFEGPHRGYQM